jgi:minor extracellular serine protease Vpr
LLNNTGTKRKFFIVFIVFVFLASFICDSPFVIGHVNGQQLSLISQDFSESQLQSDDFIEVIVQLSAPPVIPYFLNKTGNASLLSINQDGLSRYEKYLSENQISLYDSIKKVSPGSRIGYRYHFTFNGFALNIRGSDIQKIYGIKGVKEIFPSQTYKIDDDVSNKAIGADKAWEIKDLSGNNLDGTGMVIAIIDTGVDYKNPNLGGGFGPGYKVIGGYDFGDGDQDPMDLNGHGTHVAGIAAANGDLKGVAPGAKILAYKIVEGSKNTASTVNIIAAIERSVRDGADVANLSFGESGLKPNSHDPVIEAFNEAADGGVLTSIAAGNDGARCESTQFPVNTIASANKAFAVAASDDAIYPSINIDSPKVTNNSITGNYADLSPKFPIDNVFEVVDCGYGSSTDFAGVDVKGKIALVSRGPIGSKAIYFRDKDLNAEQAGAIGIIIYNNLPGLMNTTFKVQPGDENRQYIPAIFITQDNGQLLKNLIGKGLRISFGEVTHPGMFASFTSMGPTEDFYFKPEISAPGVAIKSTILGNKYAIWDGTSMATPHVAGAIALLKQAHPNWNSEDIKAAFMNTSTILTNYQNNNIVSWTLQGAGRIDIPDAVDTQAIVKPYDLLVNANSFKPYNFTIENVSNNTVEYNLSAEFTLSNFVPSNDGNGISVSFNPSNLTLEKGEEADFTVTFSIDKTKFPKGPNEGIIWLDSGGTKLHIPFIIWNGSISIPDKLSLVNVSSDTISPGQIQNSSISFEFVLRAGSDIPATQIDGNDQCLDIMDQIEIQILDMSDNVIGIIYSKSLVPIGDYIFNWNGRDIYGNYFLQDGQYQWKIVARESNNDQNNPTVIDAATLKGAFTVTNAPKGIVEIQSDISTISQEETSIISINLETFTEVNEFKGTISYNPSSVNVSEVSEGDFFKTAGETNFQYTVDASSGEIKIDLSLLSGKEISGSGTIATFIIKGRTPGNFDLSFTNSYLKDFNGNNINTVFVPLSIDITKAVNPWDLNRDGKVDDQDLAIFESVFGTYSANSDYLPIADFNSDGIIDGQDLFVICSHFGETYP